MGFNPTVELEGFVESEVDPGGVSVSGGTKYEDVVMELALFLVEVALSQWSAVAETFLATDGARGSEQVSRD